jgi:16S rRNA (guanine527-N7)-methyltransferase
VARSDRVSSATRPLLEILERARAAGFLGPGPVEAHIAHSAGFVEAAEAVLGREPASFADLGCGGGVPGLAMSLQWAAARGVLVESARRRSGALRDAIMSLGLEHRVEVLEERAELVAQRGAYRERFEVVTARSFAEPAVTAEVGAGLVTVGGVLVVSEPPHPSADRWPISGLRELGFRAAEPVERAQAHFVVLSKVAPAPERFPRPVGRPAKHPLWRCST